MNLVTKLTKPKRLNNNIMVILIKKHHYGSHPLLRRIYKEDYDLYKKTFGENNIELIAIGG